MSRANMIGIACCIFLVGWIAGIYTAFGAGNRVIDLNVKSYEHQRKIMEREWIESCVWWYPSKRIEGAPILCRAPGFLVR